MSMPWRDPSWQLKTSFKSFSALCLTTQWLNSWSKNINCFVMRYQNATEIFFNQGPRNLFLKNNILHNILFWYTILAPYYHYYYYHYYIIGSIFLNIIIIVIVSTVGLDDWRELVYCIFDVPEWFPFVKSKEPKTLTKKQVRTQVRLSEAWSCGLSDKRLISNSPSQPPLLLGSPTIALPQEPRCQEKFSVSSFYLRLSFLHHRPGHIRWKVISSTLVIWSPQRPFPMKDCQRLVASMWTNKQYWRRRGEGGPYTPTSLMTWGTRGPMPTLSPRLRIVPHNCLGFTFSPSVDFHDGGLDFNVLCLASFPRQCNAEKRSLPAWYWRRLWWGVQKKLRGVF